MKHLSNNKTDDLYRTVLEILNGTTELAPPVTQPHETYQTTNDPDRLTYGCNRLFVLTFINESMEKDLPYIASSYFSHEANNIKDSEVIDYTYSIFHPMDVFQTQMLSCMINSVRNGSEITKQLFIYLYKTHYKREYNQLKRFKRLSYRNVKTLANGNDYSTTLEKTARILFMARLLNIYIEDDCEKLYHTLNAFAGPDLFAETILITDSLFDESLQEVNNYFESPKELLELFENCNKFSQNAFVENGMDPCCCDRDATYEFAEEYAAKTLSLLKITYGNKSYTKQEIAFYTSLYYVIAFLSFSFSDLMNFIGELILGTSQSSIPGLSDKKVLAESPEDQKPLPKPEKDLRRENADIAENGPREEDNVVKIKDLRHKIDQQKEMIRQLKTEVAAKKNVEEENLRLRSDLHESNTELTTLRSFVQYMSTENIPEKETPLGDIEQLLGKKKIVVVGGRGSTIVKLKQSFKNWVFIDKKPGTKKTGVIQNADHVFFFSNVISHAIYSKYKEACYKYNVPFGYISNMNKDVIIQQIYNVLAKAS